MKFNYYAIIKYFINRISKNINGKYITNLENKIKSLKDENIKLEEEYKSYAVTCFKQRKKIKEDIKSNEHNIEVSEATLKWKKEEETLLLNDLDIFENKCKEILKK